MSNTREIKIGAKQENPPALLNSRSNNYSRTRGKESTQIQIPQIAKSIMEKAGSGKKYGKQMTDLLNKGRTLSPEETELVIS